MKTTLLKKTSTHTGDSKAAQGHLTLTFPMKSPADCAAVRSQLQASTAELYRAADAMGTLHYCRFIALDEVTVCMLADYDGELESVLDDLPKHFGPVLDPLLAHVSDAPPTPVASHAEAFVTWATARCSKSMIGYSAAPGLTARQIKSLATTAGIELDPAGAQQLPLLVIMPMKGRVASLALAGGLKLLNSYLAKGGDSVGTVHFAHLVDLSKDRIGFFTIYDGPFEQVRPGFCGSARTGIRPDLQVHRHLAADSHVEECCALHQVGGGPRPGATRVLLRLSRPPGSRHQGSARRRRVRAGRMTRSTA